MDGEFKPIKKKSGSVKKTETKEATRSNNYVKSGKVGNRKGSNMNRNREEVRQRPNNVNEEVSLLRQKNEEYKNALDVFRNKLTEVAVFNSNLAYATRLFTEHSTTKQEKINILRRFDNVETIKESKNLYKQIKEELGTSVVNESTNLNESVVERKVSNTINTGSSTNLIESTTYENPQFMRMKDLMNKIK
jgi:predicted nuclease with TOPRIM domain